VVSLISCEDKKPTVVLYTSCDDYLLRDIIPVFEKESGISVLIVGDTEATKTTGLVQRVIDEKDHPRADVWWSNEPFGTIRLAHEGLLAPYVSRTQQGAVGMTPWPKGFRGARETWYGFSVRARALAFNSKRISAESAPHSLKALIRPEWKGRVGMARPQFGTTRGELGALHLAEGDDGFRAWVKGMHDNGVRLYDGNSTVVRALASGEIDVGLTDTDDVLAGQHEGWPVESVPVPGMLIPNTVGLVHGAPHQDQAAALIDFLISPRVEYILEKSIAGLQPVCGHEKRAPLEGPDYEAIEREIPSALAVWDEVFGR
jgi:iron(III) transport system substrate-binding protein